MLSIILSFDEIINMCKYDANMPDITVCIFYKIFWRQC